MIQTRKLPRKTIIVISIMIAIGISYFLLNVMAKLEHVEKALEEMGVEYTNLKVFTTAGVKHNESDQNGYQYTIRYYDTSKQELCKGFLIILNNGEKINDVECKKED